MSLAARILAVLGLFGLALAGLAGPATLSGQPKPVRLGQVFKIQPVALSNVDLGDGAFLPVIPGTDQISLQKISWTAVIARYKVRSVHALIRCILARASNPFLKRADPG